MLTTTLNHIRVNHPGHASFAALLQDLGKTQADDESLPYDEILRLRGFEFAVWACCAEPRYDAVWSAYAIRCARRAQHLMKDPRSVAVLDVAERHLRGEATDAELSDAIVAASQVHASTAMDLGRIDAATHAAGAATFAALPKSGGNIATVVRGAFLAHDTQDREAVRKAQVEDFLCVVSMEAA
jgi:hypothetical protein